MKSFTRKAMTAVAFAAMVPVASADVLNFDDLGFAFFGAPYNGFSFGTNNVLTTAWLSDDIDPPILPYVSHSAPSHVATDASLYSGAGFFEDAQSITSLVDFKFDGAWFSGATKVLFKLFNNGALVHTSAQSGDLTRSPQFVASGYSGMVDEVVVNAEQGFFAMDDFTYNTPIPEPSSYALLALGLGALSLVGRRKA